MLEYSKTILSKVSFDRSLFEKELLKAITSVGEQIEALRAWCYEKFGNQYPKILDRHFKLSH
ncbi:hypothetical protein SAMN04488028_102250 [Reichenbachiella agariperforans]|uniref:Uncharacterized protein n=1 Tax=Reichenbachiella agariperforans TaxID=156994 RepID=A0A1M6NGH7_REIAG|nr:MULTISPECIES: hypothetical protein [Reichenbachiella]SHJ94830.1 hypothetical protein SAMN04488028_102250 [Reichenbachiella agariperforans]